MVKNSSSFGNMSMEKLGAKEKTILQQVISTFSWDS